jgi:hypothetical protein
MNKFKDFLGSNNLRDRTSSLADIVKGLNHDGASTSEVLTAAIYFGRIQDGYGSDLQFRRSAEKEYGIIVSSLFSLMQKQIPKFKDYVVINGYQDADVRDMSCAIRDYGESIS